MMDFLIPALLFAALPLLVHGAKRRKNPSGTMQHKTQVKTRASYYDDVMYFVLVPRSSPEAGRGFYTRNEAVDVASELAIRDEENTKVYKNDTYLGYVDPNGEWHG